MWKCGVRRIRDTFERANHFDKCGAATGVINDGKDEELSRFRGCSYASRSSQTDKEVQDLSKETCESRARTCQWLFSKKCDKSRSNNKHTDDKWSFEELNKNWRSAITWSGAVIIGWYASQFIHLKHKYSLNKNKYCPLMNDKIKSLHSHIFTFNECNAYKNQQKVLNLTSALKQYTNNVNNDLFSLKTTFEIENVVGEFIPTVHLVSNEHSSIDEPDLRDSKSSFDPLHVKKTSESSEDSDLGDVLNSIENKLGLAAIENGQQQDGLNLLRSAANRSHAPALYNLGVCYELGIGVKADEKKAKEFYRSASALEHPGALYNLGIYYGQGRGGLTRDIPTATRLLRLAAFKGQEDAIKALTLLETEIIESSELPNNQYNETIAPVHSALFLSNESLSVNSKSVAY